MTAAAEASRGVVGKVPGADGNGMGVSSVRRIKAAAMTGRALAAGGEVLPDRAADQSTNDGMTASAGIVNLRVSCIG